MLQKVKQNPLFWILPLYVLWHLTQLIFLKPEFLMTFPEELYRGTIAYELLTGPKSGLPSYLPDDYAGGFVVVALLAVFFFIILGPTLFALKLVPLVIFTLTLVFWFLAISRHCGRKAGVIFALLYTFSPFEFMHFSHSHMGAHPETVLFTGIVIFLLFEILYPLRHKKSRLLYVEKMNREAGIHTPPPGVLGDAAWWLFFLLGITCGFGTWFASIFAITVLSAFVLALFHGPGYLFTKKFGFFILGFLIGFSPWFISITLAYFLKTNIPAPSLIHYFSPHQLINSLVNPQESAFFQFIASFGAPEIEKYSTRWKLVNYSYFLLHMIPLAFYLISCTLKKIKRPPYAFLFFVVYTLIFIFLSELSLFRGTRFIIPFFPILFAMTAIAYQGILTSSFPLKNIAFVLIGIMLFLGLGSALSSFSTNHAGQVFQSKGYSYYYLPNGHKYSSSAFCLKPDECAETYQRFKTKISEEDKHAYALALGRKLQNNGNTKLVLEEQAAHIPHEIRPYFWYYAGFINYDQHSDWKKNQEKLNQIALLNDEGAFWIYRGMLDAKAWTLRNEFSLEGTEAFLKTIPPSLTLFVWQTAGQEHANLLLSSKIDWAMIDIQINKALTQVPTKYRGVFLKGVGASIMLHRLLEQNPGSLSLIQALPKAWHVHLLRGAASILESTEIVADFPVVRESIDTELSELQQIALHKERKRFREAFKRESQSENISQ